MNEKISVVIPTNRPEMFLKWLEAWKVEFKKYDAMVICIFDGVADDKFRDKVSKIYEWVVVYDWEDYSLLLGKKSWIIPKKAGACKSFGLWLAYKEYRADYVITLDDDCMPTLGKYIEEYLKYTDIHFKVSPYFDVGSLIWFGNHIPMRGYPFKYRQGAIPMIQYGGWDNVPDLDAVTQLQFNTTNTMFKRDVMSIDKGLAFTGCGMNVFFCREAIPMAYQLYQGMDIAGYDRWDDIWSGLFMKKICDHLNRAVVINGWASIVHTRASNPYNNLKKEEPGYLLNETMWENLQTIKLTKKNVINCYEELVNQLKPEWFPNDGKKFIEAMKVWISLFR